MEIAKPVLLIWDAIYKISGHSGKILHVFKHLYPTDPNSSYWQRFMKLLNVLSVSLRSPVLEKEGGRFQKQQQASRIPRPLPLERRSVKERKRGAGNPASDFCLKWRPNPNTGHCVEGFMGESREAMKRHFLSAGGRKIKCAALACQKRGRDEEARKEWWDGGKILSAGGENHIQETHTHTHICSEYQGCLGDIGGLECERDYKPEKETKYSLYPTWL